MSDDPHNIGVAAEAFIDQGRAKGWAASTVRNYRRGLVLAQGFLTARGCAILADVAPADLDALLAHLLAEGRAKKSRVQIAVLMKGFFGWCHDQGLVLMNPAVTLGLPDDGEQDLPEPPLSEGAVRALFDSLPRRTVIDLRNACLLELLYGCGLRVSEAVGLRVEDIAIPERVLAVRDSKRGQDRAVPIMGTALAAVADYLAVRRTLLRGPDKGTLFLNKHGTPMRHVSVYRWFEALNAKRGDGADHLHPHRFRHSIAVHLLRAGADVRYIQQFLGHSCLDTTKVYLRLVPGRLKEDYDRAMPVIAVGAPSGGVDVG
jgi:integrase/recombinase XerD